MTTVDPSPNKPRQWTRRLTHGIPFVAVAILVAVATMFHLHGGRWLDVKTPSMGQAAPVGTLLLIQPFAPTDHLTVGDIIAFHPPTSPKETYAHRVVAIDADGTIHTRGDINDIDDPWRLHHSDLIGIVAARLWNLGYIIRMLPLLVLGAVVIYAATGYHKIIRHDHTTPARILGYSVLVSLALYIYKPLVRVALITQTTNNGTTTTTVVPTGLIPVTVHAIHGTTTDLRPGHVGTVTTGKADTTGHYHIALTPHLNHIAWITLAILCLTPLLTAILIGTPRQPDNNDPPQGSDQSRLRRGFRQSPVL